MSGQLQLWDLNRWVSRPESLSEHSGEEKISNFSVENQDQAVQIASGHFFD